MQPNDTCRPFFLMGLLHNYVEKAVAGLFAVDISAASFGADERVEAGRLSVLVPDNMRLNWGNAFIGNVEVYSFDYFKEEWERNFAVDYEVRELENYFPLISNADVSEEFGHEARLFVNSSKYKDYLTVVLFAKSAAGEVIRFREIRHREIDVHAADGKGETPDWPTDPASISEYYRVMKGLMDFYIDGFNTNGKNAFYLPAGHFSNFPPQYEELNVWLTENVFEDDSIVYGIRFDMCWRNKGHEEPVQFPRPPFPPVPNIAKEVIRESYEIDDAFRREQKIIIEANERTKEIIGLKATLTLDAPEYILRIKMSAPEQHRDAAIVCWDKVLDGLQVNY